MRCKNCGVDLGEEYTLCPLCGEKAANEPPVLEGFKTAEYPKYRENAEFEKPKFKADYPLKYILRAVWVLCCLFGVAVLLGAPEKLWSVGAPVAFAATAAVYFTAGFFEKGKLLHSGVALFSTLLSSGVFTLLSLFSKAGAISMLDSLLVCLALFLLLWAIKPSRMKEQLKALFVL